MQIDYGRGSTRNQNPDDQHLALVAAGRDEVFVDKAGGKLASRPKLDEALRISRKGDQLVVTKLDRLGRSLEHLMALSKQLQAKQPRGPRSGHRHVDCGRPDGCARYEQAMTRRGWRRGHGARWARCAHEPLTIRRSVVKLGTLAANGAAGFVINCPTIAFTQQEPVIE